MNKGDLPRIKLDLTADELIILPAVQRPVHHPYSDIPEEGIVATSYSYEEIFAEKLRTLAERERPRDLYDVIHLFRHDHSQSKAESIKSTFCKKCAFKEITPPSILEMESSPGFIELKAEWANMLAHQLPALPPFESFWNELPQVFEWLEEKPLPPIPAPLPVGPDKDATWRPSSMMVSWGMEAPIEVIRYAAANRLCIDLRYDSSRRLIEPYSLRRTKDGNILLHAIKHQNGEHRSYRLDRIQGATATTTSFVPKYTVEIGQAVHFMSESPSRAQATSTGINRNHGSLHSAGLRKRNTGPTYVVKCPSCGKQFSQSQYDMTLNPHKTPQGFQCSGRMGYLLKTKY